MAMMQSAPDSRRRSLGLLLNLLLFGIAFGFIEGAVVVYLRAIAYPDGFGFPLAPVPELLLRTEIVREAATLLLLLAVARIARPDGLGRFAVFAFCFAVWDLAYYLTLAVVLGWPAGWLDWDILFLIPLPWTSPVLAPLLVSLALIGAACAILFGGEAWTHALRLRDWLIGAFAGALILASFLWNAGAINATGAPDTFPWWLFAAGMGLGIACFATAVRRGLRG
jgi:hypothetical protein